MKILITGAAGFLGSHLCARFIADGYSVVGIDNLSTGRLENITPLLSHGSFEFVQHDICRGIDISGELDAVLHFASPASPQDYGKMPIATLDVGSVGTKNALEIARQRQARFLLASTSEIYGDPLVNPQPESYRGNTNTTGARSVYDESKRFAEAMTMAFHRVYGIDTRIVRLFNTYGPHMKVSDGRIIPNFITQALSGEPLTVYGSGLQTRSLCYIDDTVSGILALLSTPDINGIHSPVNIGNPHEMTVLRIAETIIKLTESQSIVKYCELPEDDPCVRCPDIHRAQEILGWNPKIFVEDGLKATIAYFKTGELCAAR